jgi:polyphosphate glucokinase
MNDSEPAGTPKTLAIDIGGTGLKAAVLDATGKMVTERARVPTPSPCPPEILVTDLAKLVAPLPPHDRISIGFPGVVRDGRIITAPHLADKAWVNYPLEQVHIERASRRPGC